jgi:hypothetical protein
MATEMQGKLLPLEIDFAGAATNYDVVVCMQNFDMALDVPLDVQDTDCGQIASPGTGGINISVTAIDDLAPGASQGSYKKCFDAALDGDKVSVRVRNPVVGSVALGTAIYATFSAYISNVTLQKNTTGPVTFTMTIQSTGAIDGTV